MDATTDASVPMVDDSADTAGSPASDKSSMPSREAQRWRTRIARTRRYKRDLIENWRTNIDFRRGKVFSEDSDDDRVAVAYDWGATKAKQAGLFSQVPKIRLKAKKKQYQQGTAVFARKVNDALDRADVGTSMDEVLPDVINAAGIGAVYIAFESRTFDKEMPVQAAPPPPPAPMSGMPPPPPSPEGEAPAEPAPGKTETVPYTSATRTVIERISPADLLWDLTFAGSNFNRSPWIGRSGKMHWSRAQKEFNLSADDKALVCTTGSRSAYDRMNNNEDQDLQSDVEMVEFDEVFYWRYLFHDDEPSFEAIQRIVFVHGKNEAVVDERWKGQQLVDGDPEKLIGSCLPPIQVLTLTYLSDEAIPPSDSAMGRPGVEEMIAARTDMMLQRRYSSPMRWFNTVMVPPELVSSMMRGTFQGMIPLNGPGERAVGEVARANFPRETYESDHVFKAELGETWNIGGSQGFGGGSNTQIRTAAEANNAQSNMETRQAYERGRVSAFFARIAEVVAGLETLYGTWDEEDKAALAGLDLQHMSRYYIYSVRTDASVLLTADQRYARLEKYWNMTAKSGLVDEVPVLQELGSLIDIDEELVKQPQPKQEPINVSFRVDAESLKDPMFVAMLIQTGQMPGPDLMEQAKKAILASIQLPAPPQPPPPPGGPGGPGGPPPPSTQDHHPEIDMASRVNTRAEDGK